MIVQSADLTAFFELSAKYLGVSAKRLAGLVNNYDTITLSEWDTLAEEDDVQMVDIERLRVRLSELMERARYN